MSWSEFREFAALAAIGLGSFAAVAVAILVVLVLTGAAVGATAGAFLWAFDLVSGVCR
jgi:hypothetical protein